MNTKFLEGVRRARIKSTEGIDGFGKEKRLFLYRIGEIQKRTHILC